MEYITVGKKYNEGKIAAVKCVKDDSLENIHIKDKCFLLIILTKGELVFTVKGEKSLPTPLPFCVLMSWKIPPLFLRVKGSTPVSIFIPNI